MAFKGTLREFKVPDILQLISLQKKNGILTFTSQEGFITLIFSSGTMIGVDAFPKKLELRVGNVLVKQELVSEEMLKRALAIQKRTNQKVGEILIGMGLIDEGTIRTALSNQAREIVLSLFKWKKGEYNFKVMEDVERTVQHIDPIHTDGIIMEGVQMLDEWPLIRKHISDDSVVFAPIDVHAASIEIIDDYEDEKEEDGRIFINNTEAKLLRYINGTNSVKDLAELGIFTEYKLYKSLYNLVRRNVIKKKEQASGQRNDEVLAEEILNEERKQSARKLMLIGRMMLLVIVVILMLTFFSPFMPWDSSDIIGSDELINTIIGKN